MPRDYKADAARFIQGLPRGIGDGIDVPSIFEVQKARIQEFPILDAGVKARSKALRESVGKEYSLTTIWDAAVSRGTREAGEAGGNIVLDQPGRQSCNLPFKAEPGSLTSVGSRFAPEQEDEMASRLDELLQEALS